MNIFRDYLPLLGLLFYGEPSQLSLRWAEIPSEMQNAFLHKLFKEGFSGLAVQKLPGAVLPVSWFQQARQRMQQEMFHAMRDEVELKKLFVLFETERIRYIPLKGIDLAYRIYPSPSMRPFGDWDIFFPPEDIDRAHDVLLSHGWKEILKQSRDLHHHDSPLTKGPHFLEPHWTFSCCMNASPTDIWELSVPSKESSCKHYLSPELNVLLATRHAAEGLYRTVNITKLLLDVAFIIKKEGIDWKLMREVAAKLHQPYPGHLLASFSEFFPEDILGAMQSNPEKTNNFRKIFRMRKEVSGVTPAEVMLQADDSFSYRWFRSIFRVFYPKNLRAKYGLSEHVSKTELLKCYWKEIFSKCQKFCNHIFTRNDALDVYKQLIKKAEGIEEIKR